jgi:hypothetical protein
VVLELLALHPDARPREELDAPGVIPVQVGEDDVGHLVGGHAGARDGGGGQLVVAHLPPRGHAVWSAARIDEDIAPVRPPEEPDHQGQVHAPLRIRAGDQRVRGERRQHAIADREDLVDGLAAGALGGEGGGGQDARRPQEEEEAGREGPARAHPTSW